MEMKFAEKVALAVAILIPVVFFGLLAWPGALAALSSFAGSSLGLPIVCGIGVLACMVILVMRRLPRSKKRKGPDADPGVGDFFQPPWGKRR
jgi:hypothetical protein